MTLTEFLMARLDEDETVARAASPGPWSAEDEEVKAVDDITVCDAFALSSPQTRATAEHIARHDPARVLAEVAAKRNLIQLHRQDGDAPWCMEGCGMRAGGPEWPCDTLYRMASVYVDHPDYRDEWKP